MKRTIGSKSARALTNGSNPLRGVVERRPRIGVAPFLPNRIPEDEELAASISSEVAAALAQCSWFQVVPPRSTVGRSASALLDRQDSQFEELDYVVEGAVSSDDRRAHVSVRVLDLGECARTVWSEHAVVTIAKVHRWSQRVASRISGAIDPVVLFFAGRPRQRVRDGATGLLLLAIPMMFAFERRKYEEAGRLIDRALEIEPDNGLAAAWGAFWQVFYFGQGWTQNFVKASAIAQHRARRAISLKPDNAETLAMCGHVTSFLGRDYDTALHYFDRARRLDPTLEFPWLWSALTYSYAGKPGSALEQLKQYRTLTSMNPVNTWTQYLCAIAYIFSENYGKVVELSQPMTKSAPGFVNAYKPLVASLGHLGRAEEAKPYVDKLLALEPNFTVERFGKVYPIKYESDREHYMKGLRLAGVPER
jgi:TolB-like protein/tetratricopeptide (TPR) repeat protein